MDFLVDISVTVINFDEGVISLSQQFKKVVTYL